MRGQDRTVESWRNDGNELLLEALSLYGDRVATDTVDFFDDVMEFSGSDIRGSMPVGIYTRGEVERIGHHQAEKVVHDDIDAYIEGMAISAANIVYQTGLRTMFYQAGVGVNHVELDVETGQSAFIYGAEGYSVGGGYEVRYRRIPQGIETCDFCLMLASRGAVYITEESAMGSSADDVNHVHRNCDCIVVPCLVHYENRRLVQDTYIEGYDTDVMYTLWQEWREVSARDDISREVKDELKLQLMRARMGRDTW